MANNEWAGSHTLRAERGNTCSLLKMCSSDLSSFLLPGASMPSIEAAGWRAWRGESTTIRGKSHDVDKSFNIFDTAKKAS